LTFGHASAILFPDCQACCVTEFTKTEETTVVIGARGLLITFVAFLLLSAVIHLNGSPASLLSDDFVILRAVDQGGAFGMWTDSSRAFLRPLVSLLFWTEYQLWHLNPMGYRVVSVLLHSLCSLLVMTIGLMIMVSYGSEGRRASYLAVFAGLLFLTSASHSEPVSWASCQGDLLAAFFGLLALWLYIRGRTTGSRQHLVAAVPLFACSLLSKESTAALPLLLVCYEAFGRRLKASGRGTRIRDLVQTAPYFITVVLYIGMRYLVIGSALSGYANLAGLRPQAGRVLIGLASFPTRTYLPPLPTRPVAVSVFGVLLLAVLVAMYVTLRRRRKAFPRAIPLLLMLYLISLLPVIRLAISKTLTEGERLAYFPSAFGMLLLVAVLDFIIGRIRIITVTVACLALAAGLLLFRAERRWKDAAEITRGITNSLETMAGGGTLVIFNLPDNLKGAHVFRNGFREMLSMSGLSDKWEEVVVLATADLITPADSIRTERLGQLIRVTQSNPRAVFRKPGRRLQESIDTRCFHIIEFAADSYTFELASEASVASDGRVRFTYCAHAELVPSRID
jgi:hypothetical protein